MSICNNSNNRFHEKKNKDCEINIINKEDELSFDSIYKNAYDIDTLEDNFNNRIEKVLLLKKLLTIGFIQKDFSIKSEDISRLLQVVLE